MDEFINTIDHQKFRATNALWNNLCLNDPWSVGYVSTLIETKSFNSKEEWEIFYYQSGNERNEIITEKFSNFINLLNNHTLKKTNPAQIQNLDWALKNVNFQFGRTKEQLTEKGIILYNFLSRKGANILQDECIECVRFRTICETWNGIIIRERNTIEKLKETFKNIEFHKTTGDFDHKYAVDYELKHKNRLICGIQIKPKSYTYNTSYLNKAKSANSKKNLEYKTTFNKNVFDVISQANGTIINNEVLTEIKLEIEKGIVEV